MRHDLKSSGANQTLRALILLCMMDVVAVIFSRHSFNSSLLTVFFFQIMQIVRNNVSADDHRIQTPLRYVAQLDALRAFAVAGVLMEHYIPFVDDHLSLGGFGVKLFFTLSGYLITSILLRCRAQLDGGKESSGALLKKFYARRFLRTFPIYYAALFFMALINLPFIRETFFWHFFYLSNVWDYLHHTYPGAAMHFWSLAVEEQFYLVCPCLILFVPRRRLIFVPLLAIVTGILFRLIGALGGMDYYGIYTLTPANLDTLGLGALLAMCMNDSFAPSTESSERIINGLRWAGWRVGVPLWLLLLLPTPLGRISISTHGMTFKNVFLDIPMGLISIWLVTGAIKGFKGRLGAQANQRLGWKPLVYLGSISYGIYMYHLIIPAALLKLEQHFDLAIIAGMRIRVYFVVMSALTILAATVSWHFFEKPINNLKRYFNY